MNIFPTRELTIECSVSLQKARSILERYVDKPKEAWYQSRWPFERNIFRGKIDEKNFKLTSTARLDSYLLISGSFVGGEHSTQIKLRIKDPLPFHNSTVSIILLIFFLLIFGTLAYSGLNTIIQNRIINLLLVSLFLVTSGGAAMLIEILTRKDQPNSNDLIDKCAIFFNDIFSEHFSLPYSLPGFIRLKKSSVFDFDNRIMHQ